MASPRDLGPKEAGWRGEDAYEHRGTSGAELWSPWGLDGNGRRQSVCAETAPATQKELTLLELHAAPERCQEFEAARRGRQEVAATE